MNLLLTLKYRIPTAGAHSITAAAFLGTTAFGFSFPQLAGAFILSSILVLLAGISGIFAKAMDLIPKHLIDALLAGLLLTYVIGIIPAVVDLPLSGALAGIGYFLVPRFTKRFPSTLWAFLLGLIGLILEYRFPTLPHVEFFFPLPIMPEFSIKALLSISFPMALLILSNDFAVALASLKSNQYDPPVNKILTASGFASVVAGLFGGHAANIGGLMSAICSSPEAGP